MTNLTIINGKAVYVSGTLNQISYCLPISAQIGAMLSDIIQIRLIRDVSNASLLFAGSDPYLATVGITSVDIHYEIDSIGSSSEYVK